ncbi:MAG TPA: hypothetical protein VFU99_07650 [Gaiellaceae bacterium]|jgi:hypothetical protein|nr:hypothetical protein [Gaiellaceae bacterium]
MRIRLLVFLLPVLVTVGLTSVAYGTPAETDMARTEAAGWDCTPKVPIAGQYFHCAPPGQPSVADLVSTQGITQPTLSLRVFNVADESFAGIESLIRDDLYNGERTCPQDAKNLPNGVWGLLALPGQDYRACHRFERTTTS